MIKKGMLILCVILLTSIFISGCQNTKQEKQPVENMTPASENGDTTAKDNTNVETDEKVDEPFIYSYLEEIEKDERFIRKIALTSDIKYQDYGACSFIPLGDHMVDRYNIVWFMDVDNENKKLTRSAFGESEQPITSVLTLDSNETIFDTRTTSFDIFLYTTTEDDLSIKRFNFFDDKNQSTLTKNNSKVPKRFLFEIFDGSAFYGIDSNTSKNVIFFEETYRTRPYPPTIYMDNSYTFLNAFITSDKKSIAAFCYNEEQSTIVYQIYDLDGKLIHSSNYPYEKEVIINAVNIKNINEYYVFYNNDEQSYVEEISSNENSARVTQQLEENKRLCEVLYKNNLYLMKLEDDDNYYINTYNRDLTKLNSYVIKKSDNVTVGDIRFISFRDQYDTLGFILIEDNNPYFIECNLNKTNEETCYNYNSDDFFNIYVNDHPHDIRSIEQNFYGSLDYMYNPVSGDVYLTEDIYNTVRYICNIDSSSFDSTYGETKVNIYPGNYIEVYNKDKLIIQDQIHGDDTIIAQYDSLKENYNISNIFYSTKDLLYFIDKNILYSFDLNHNVQEIYDLSSELQGMDNLRLFAKDDYLIFFNDTKVFLYHTKNNGLDKIMSAYPQPTKDNALYIEDSELVFEYIPDKYHDHNIVGKYYLDLSEKAFINYRAKDINYSNSHGFFWDNKFYPLGEAYQEGDFFIIDMYEREQKYIKFNTEKDTFIASNALEKDNILYLTDYQTGNLYQMVNDSFEKLNNENIRTFDIDKDLLAYSGFQNEYGLYISNIQGTSKKKIYNKEVENIIIDDQNIYFLDMREHTLSRYNTQTDSVESIVADELVDHFQINNNSIIYYNGNSIKICDKNTLEITDEISDVCEEFISNDNILVFHTKGFAIAKYTFEDQKIEFISFAGPACWFEKIEDNTLYYTESIEASWSQLYAVDMNQNDTDYENSEFALIEPITEDIMLLCYDPFINYFEPFGHNPYSYSIFDKKKNTFVHLASYSYDGVYLLNDKLYYWVSDINYEEKILHSYDLLTGEIVKESDFNQNEAKCIIKETPDIQP